MLAIFNTIGQLVGGLCRDHTIAKGLSLKFATSGGLELEAQWAGRQSEGLVTAALLMGLQTKRLCTQDRRGGSWWGGSELFCIQCVVSLGPAGRRNVRCCVLSDYACLLAQRTSVAGSGWVESAIDNRPPSNIGRACVTTKEAKRKIITASER